MALYWKGRGRRSQPTAGAASRCGSIVTTGPALPSLPRMPVSMCAPAPALESLSQDSTALGTQSPGPPVSFLLGAAHTGLPSFYLCLAPVPVPPSAGYGMPLHGSPALLRWSSPNGLRLSYPVYPEKYLQTQPGSTSWQGELALGHHLCTPPLLPCVLCWCRVLAGWRYAGSCGGVPLHSVWDRGLT